MAEAAAASGADPVAVAADVALFCRAGHQALEARDPWWQLYLEFADWHRADGVAAERLVPTLRLLESEAGLSWWYIRKHPCWRLRLRTPDREERMRVRIETVLNTLVRAGHLRRWWTGVYEPESIVFGGPEGMEAAHELFHADSRAVLTVQEQDHPGLGRRELSVLLCSALIRGAGLEWYEQGEVWHRVAQERPLPEDIAEERIRAMAGDVHALLQADVSSGGPLFAAGGAAAVAASWAEAFHTTGRVLGKAARDGSLQRGLRQVLAYHVIFHWNRLGLRPRAQSALAWAARTAVLDRTH